MGRRAGCGWIDIGAVRGGWWVETSSMWVSWGRVFMGSWRHDGGLRVRLRGGEGRRGYYY